MGTSGPGQTLDKQCKHRSARQSRIDCVTGPLRLQIPVYGELPFPDQSALHTLFQETIQVGERAFHRQSHFATFSNVSVLLVVVIQIHGSFFDRGILEPFFSLAVVADGDY